MKTVVAGAAKRPTGTSSAAGTAPSTGSTSGISGHANGAELASYSIDLSDYYSVPLGATKPSQSQFASGAGGDLYDNGAAFEPGSDEQLVSLPGGVMPGYKACSTGTTFDTEAMDTGGASFCVIETSGKLAGVYVSSDQSGYAVLQITVWQYTSQ